MAEKYFPEAGKLFCGSCIEIGQPIKPGANQLAERPMPASASVLIIDDDPMHLRIYGWIVEAAGYTALPAQVMADGVELPESAADLVLLDYNFAGRMTAVEVAKLVQGRLPRAPILLLSDAFSLPDDIAPHVQGFIRKGDPAKLVDKLHAMLGPAREMTIPEVLNL